MGNGEPIVCFGTTIPPEIVRRLVKLRDCCLGAFEDGPTACTCWEPVYNLEDQQPPDLSVEPTTRQAMCDDCAYRPDSPERTGSDHYAHSDPGDLDRLGAPFWCHQGMRKPVVYRHPAGIVIEVGDVDHYDPPIVAGVPYRADGTPGQRCAGWAAHQRTVHT